jgi:hypothetical protein
MGKELGTCIMDDMEDDDGTGRDPLVDRVERRAISDGPGKSSRSPGALHATTRAVRLR